MSNPIEIEVETEFLSEHKASREDKYAFAYKIVIRNRGQEQVQLLSRYWLITDANGKKTEVRGPGVVGEQPNIASGKTYRYVSGAILDTPVGSMEGYYEMRRTDGSLFNAPVPVFGLAVPNILN